MSGADASRKIERRSGENNTNPAGGKFEAKMEVKLPYLDPCVDILEECKLLRRYLREKYDDVGSARSLDERGHALDDQWVPLPA